MQFELIRNLPEMNALAAEWNELLADSASHVPFLRNEYLSTWWQTLGGGEWPQGELCVVSARQEGLLTGIAPLFFTTNRESEPALMLLGCIEISDYLDLIAPAQTLQPFIDGLFDILDGLQAPAWRVLDLWNFQSTSPSLPALEAAAARKGWSYTPELLQHCPYIPLPGDWEAYLAGIDKKQRHEIRRKMRRLESEVPSRWYIVEEDEASLEAELEAFMDMMAQDLNKRRFLTDTMRVQFRTSMCAAFRAGWLQLAFLEIGGEKAAGYINFDYLNSIWVYNSAINFKFREQSPGWVLLGYLLQWANEHKREVFDFMRGDEDYKYRFGGVDRRVVRAVIRRV